MENRISICIHIHEDGGAWVDVSLPANGKVMVKQNSAMGLDSGYEVEPLAKETDPDDEGFLYDNLY